MSRPATHEERLRTNYNAVGVAVMQAIYSDGYLSLGGTDSTDTLADLADIDDRSEVLDIGCGVGGPMLHLASTRGCHVTGIDLVESNVVEAQDRAASQGLGELLAFEQGDACALPYADESFDVVWGQDAWCHVPDRVTLLAEAARVLRPGGSIVFTDWLTGDRMSEPERAAALDAALSSSAATAAEYEAMLAGAGFINIERADISTGFCDRYREICDGLSANRESLTTRFGERVYEIVREMNTTILGGFEGGAIGGGRFLAVKPR